MLDFEGLDRLSLPAAEELFARPSQRAGRLVQAINLRTELVPLVERVRHAQAAVRWEDLFS